MTVYEQELRKLFEHSNLVDRPQFSGRVCVGDLGKDLRVRAEFLCQDRGEGENPRSFRPCI